MAQLAERTPDRLVNAERVRVLDERGEQEVQRLVRPSTRDEMARERKPGAPVVRRFLDQSAAELGKPVRVARSHGQCFEAIERQVRSIRCDLDQCLPDPRRLSFVALSDTNVAQIQVRRYCPAVEIDRCLVTANRLRVILPRIASRPSRFSEPEIASLCGRESIPASFVRPWRVS